MIRDGTEKMKQGMWRRQHTGLLHSFKRYHLDQCTFPLCHKVWLWFHLLPGETEKSHKNVGNTSVVTLLQCLPSEMEPTKPPRLWKKWMIEMAFQILTDSICMSSHKEWLHPGLTKNAFWEHGQSVVMSWLSDPNPSTNRLKQMCTGD